MGSVTPCAALIICLLPTVTYVLNTVVNMPSKGSRGSSKKAKKSGSNVFDTFTQEQVAQFKDGFQIMDRDRDGVLGKQDLRGVFDEIGRLAVEDELDAMLAESEAPINFTTFLSMFAAKSTGENDPDDVLIKAIRAFEKSDQQIDAENFRGMLMGLGDKLSGEEVDQAFEAFDDYFDEDTGLFDANGIIEMLVGADDSK